MLGSQRTKEMSKSQGDMLDVRMDPLLTVNNEVLTDDSASGKRRRSAPEEDNNNIYDEVATPVQELDAPSAFSDNPTEPVYARADEAAFGPPPPPGLFSGSRRHNQMEVRKQSTHRYLGQRRETA